MRRLLFVALVLLLLLGGGMSVAEAHFLIFPIVSAVVANVFAAQVITFVITAALSVGLSYVANQLLNKGSKPSTSRSPDAVGGTQLDIRVDPDTQRSIIFGRTTTAGSLVYANTYGKLGTTENSNLIQIIALSDYPISSIVETWVDGKERAVTGTTEKTVTDFIKKDPNPDPPVAPDVALLRYLLHNGTQTTADSIAVSHFGLDPLRPWTSDMKGLGVAYVRTQEIYDQDLVPGMTAWRFVIDGAKLYDLRKDNGVPGGSGTHVWNVNTAGLNSSTYTFTQNAAIIAYNILRGIYYKGLLVYGLGLDANQLPANVWIDAANKCASAVGTGGETSGTYLWGAEITVDTEPMSVIREIIKACGGRFVEIGGVYKMYVGTVAVPQWSFTDSEIVGNRESSFKPFLPMEQRVNYMTGRYTSPQTWLPKISPPRLDALRIAEDGRRLPAELDCPGVHNQTQMQRLMKQMLFRSRQERRHVLTLPPPAFILEAGDIVEWTSARNGYPTKLFDVESVEYHDNLCVTVSITELDPTDYNWDAGDLINEPDGPLPTQRPPPKVIEGFTVTAITVSGGQNVLIPGSDPPAYEKKDQKPAILVEWVDPVDDDFYAVDIQYRRFGTAEIFTDRGNDVPAQAVTILANLAPSTLYQVRGKYRTHSGKRAAWHAWQNVTTTAVRPKITDGDASIKQYVEDYSDARSGEVATSLGSLKSLYLLFTGTTYPADKRLIKTEWQQADATVVTGYQAAIFTATDLAKPHKNAIATKMDSLETKVNDMSAGVKVGWFTAATPAGAIASYWLRVSAAVASQRTYAGMQVVVSVNAQGVKTSQMWFDVNYFMVGRGSAKSGYSALFTIESVAGKPAKVVLRGDFIASGSIKATHIFATTLGAIKADLGTVTAGKLILTKNPVGTNYSMAGRITITDNKTVAASPPEITIDRWVP